MTGVAARSSRQFIGLDPGKKGGIVVLDGESRLLFATRLQWLGTGKRSRLDLDELTRVLRGQPLELSLRLQSKWDPLLVVEEPEQQQRNASHKGDRAMRLGGEQLGVIFGLTHTLKVPLHLVRAAHWSPYMLHGRVKDLKVEARPGETEADRRLRRSKALRDERKAAALLLAKELWPDLPIEHKADDGIADAALLAEFGRRCHLVLALPPNPTLLKEVESDV